MNKPRVKLLRYRLITSKNYFYSNPPPLEIPKNSEFHGELKNGILTVYPIKDYPSKDGAEIVAKDFLEAWEIFVGIEKGLGIIEFIFDSVEMEDLNASNKALSLSGTTSISFSCSANLLGVLNKYPSPPEFFQVNDTVRLLWLRYKNFKDGKELLLGMGYYCLSKVLNDVENDVEVKKTRDKIKAAGLKYRIANAVLRELSNITSRYGDGQSARKYTRDSTNAPLTANEEKWVEETIKMLIKRIAQFPLGAPETIALITMGDLPSI
tara:strand:- start:3817 stop:4614 length:798 start_codon:yes stop_codon:yes gene_type:complete